MRHVIPFLVAAATVAASACAVFSSDEPGLGEDAGPDGTTPLGDGATPPFDSAATDAVADGANDGGTPSPCLDAGHWLCDDFDRDAAAGFPSWGTVLAGEGGISIVPLASAPSAPNVFNARAGSNDGAQLASVHSGTANGLHCELDMFVEQRSATEALLFVLSFGNPAGGGYFYRVELRGGGDKVLQYGAVNGVGLPQVATGTTFAKKWQHVVVDLRVGATQQLHVDVDGVAVVSAPALDAGALALPNTQSVTVGVSSFGGAGEWTVRYDNVFCDVVP